MKGRPWLTTVLVAAALLRLIHVGPLYTDDPFVYYKVSGVMTNTPPNHDPVALYASTSPAKYVPHPGLNLPYRDFVEEYPPLALLFFVLPRLAADNFPAYLRMFGLEMAALDVLLGVLLWRLGLRKREAAFWWALFTLCTAFLIDRRFDAAPTALAAGALVMLLSACSGWAGVLLGLGAATKVWPGLLAPVFLLPSLLDRDWRRAGRLLGGIAVGFLGPHLPFIALAGSKAFSYLAYHAARGLQVESTWANLVMITENVSSLSAFTRTGFGALEVTSQERWTSLFLWASYTTAAAGYALVLWLAAMRLRTRPAERRETLIAASLAVVLVAIATGKVFSPQFIVWLFPLAFVLPNPSLRWGSVVVAALTGFEYPYAYFDWIETGTWQGIVLVLVRNLLVWWLAWQALREVHGRVRAAAH